MGQDGAAVPLSVQIKILGFEATTKPATTNIAAARSPPAPRFIEIKRERRNYLAEGEV